MDPEKADYYKWRRNPETNHYREFDLPDKRFKLTTLADNLGISRITSFMWVSRKGLKSTQEKANAQHYVMFSDIFYFLRMNTKKNRYATRHLKRLEELEPELYAAYEDKFQYEHHILVTKIDERLPERLTLRNMIDLTGFSETKFRRMLRDKVFTLDEDGTISGEDFYELLQKRPDLTKRMGTFEGPREVLFAALPKETQEEIRIAREELYDLNMEYKAREQAIATLDAYIKQLKNEYNKMKRDGPSPFYVKQRRILKRWAFLEEMGITFYDGPLAIDDNLEEKMDAIDAEKFYSQDH